MAAADFVTLIVNLIPTPLIAIFTLEILCISIFHTFSHLIPQSDPKITGFD